MHVLTDSGECPDELKLLIRIQMSTCFDFKVDWRRRLPTRGFIRLSKVDDLNFFKRQLRPIDEKFGQWLAAQNYPFQIRNLVAFSLINAFATL